MTAIVQILTLVSQTQVKRGRYALSFDVTPKKKTTSVYEKRKSEEQVYTEYKSLDGGCSPEINLKLKNKQCDILFSVSGALKPRTELEKGENVLEFNESLNECRRLLTVVPTYDPDSQGTATIKFKVDGSVKHVVLIHDVPVERPKSSGLASSGPDERSVFGATGSRQSSMRASQKSNTSEGSVGDGSVGHWSFSSTGSQGTSRKASMASNPSCQSLPNVGSDDEILNFEDTNVNAGSVHEQPKIYASGAGAGEDLQAKPVYPRTPPVGQFNGMNINEQGPTFVPPTGSPQHFAPTAWTASPQHFAPPIAGPTSPQHISPPTAGTTSPQYAAAPGSPIPAGLQAVPYTPSQTSPTPSAGHKTSPYASRSSDGCYADSNTDEAMGENAYDNVLSNQSLNVLASALSPSDANRLVIGLGVPHAEHQTNLRNHPGDVVSGNFASLHHWRSKRWSSKAKPEVYSKQLFEDLLKELDDMGRKDIKMVLKRVLEEDRKLEKRDFKHY